MNHRNVLKSVLFFLFLSSNLTAIATAAETCPLKDQILVFACVAAEKNKILDAAFILQCFDHNTFKLAEGGSVLLYVPPKNDQADELQNIQVRELKIKKADSGVVEFKLRPQDQDIISDFSLVPGSQKMNSINKIRFICQSHRSFYPALLTKPILP